MPPRLSSTSGRSLRVLALEPYYGGSHRAFLDGWRQASRHRFTLLTLPPHSWKWRMRGAAITFARRLREGVDEEGGEHDVLFASSMLGLAELRGLAPREVAELPAVLYFHENQLTYPVRRPDRRDHHFAFTHLTGALAAREVWFNSEFHRSSFLDALAELVPRLPDHQPRWAVEEIRGRSFVEPPGIDDPCIDEPCIDEPGIDEPCIDAQRGENPEVDDEVDDGAAPLHLLWAARWEHDKAPETFFAALDRLVTKRVPFRVSVLGECFREVPPVFAEARERLGDRVAAWGFQETPEAYRAALRRADVVVSTARHEFFGLAVLEAAAAGARPLLPRRLAYPELFGELDRALAGGVLYDGGAEELAARIAALAEAKRAGRLWGLAGGGADPLPDPLRGRRAAAPYLWGRRGPSLDAALERAVDRVSSSP